MGALSCFPKPRKPLASSADADDVFPVYSSDDTSIYRKITLNWTLRFDDVLDVEMLQDSLNRLLSTGNWRKLGGRLRLASDGKLVLHVPKEFTTLRPAVRFSCQSFASSIDDHPLASHLPKGTGNQLSKHLGPKSFRPFGMRPGAPTCLDDLLNSDEPLLAVHFTSFSDATIIGLLWPHTMMGAMGLSAFMKAWSLTLAGRESEVLELQDVHQDLLEEAGTQVEPGPEPYLLAGKRLGGFKLLRFGLDFLWRTSTRPKRELEVFFLPSSFISKLRNGALEELRAASGEQKFVSEGDVLCAWATRIVSKQQGKDRHIFALNLFDVQSRLTSFFKPGRSYVQNTSFGAVSLFSGQEVADASFGQTALRFREDVVQQSTEKQILAQHRLTRAAEKSGSPLLFGEPKSSLLMITNWTRAKFYDIVDFSPAVLDHGMAEKKPRKGKIVYHHSESVTSNPTPNNIFVVLGKDSEGNYWVASSFLSECWAEVEEIMKQGS